MRMSNCPASTSLPEVAITASTTPSRSAQMLLNTFIASMTQSVSPVLTACPATTNGGASGEGVRCTMPNSGARTSVPGGLAAAEAPGSGGLTLAEGASGDPETGAWDGAVRLTSLSTQPSL